MAKESTFCREPADSPSVGEASVPEPVGDVLDPVGAEREPVLDGDPEVGLDEPEVVEVLISDEQGKCD